MEERRRTADELSWKSNRHGLRMVAGCIAVISFLAALFGAFGEKRLVGGIAEEFVATLIYWLMLIIPIWFGAWVGMTCFDKWQSKLFGWAVGLTVSALCYGGIKLMGDRIPGVGWRLERLTHSDGDQ